MIGNPVYKCEKCTYGPCYIQTRANGGGSIFGDGDTGEPHYCPHFADEPEAEPEFELCATEANPYKLRWIDGMQEWLDGEGWDSAPQEIKDVVYSDIQPKGFQAYELLRITGLLRELEADQTYGALDREELEKKLKKYSRWELLNAVLWEGFRAGVIYGEYVRQKAGKGEA